MRIVAVTQKKKGTKKFFLIKVDKGKGGLSQVDKQIPNVNIFNFIKVDKGGGGLFCNPPLNKKLF